MRAGKLILLGTATIAIGAAWALARVNRDIDAVFGDWPAIHPEMVGMETGAESFGAGWRKGGRRSPVTNAIQTNQTEQVTSHSKSPIKSGRVGS